MCQSNTLLKLVSSSCYWTDMVDTLYSMKAPLPLGAVCLQMVPLLNMHTIQSWYVIMGWIKVSHHACYISL